MTMDIYKAKKVEGGDASNSTDGNDTVLVQVVECNNNIPTAQELFNKQHLGATIILCVGIVCTIFVFVVFFEECLFITRHFRKKPRRMLKTLWVLAIYPVYAFTGLLGAVVPRAGTLVDLVANVYLATCMYEFVRLMVDYMGGDKRMWAALEDVSIPLRTPPCCCCLFCLPHVKFTRSLYLKLQILVLQVAIVRPILFFVAGVLWANGNYTPGVIAANNAYIYVSALNLFSTFWAVYGLVLTQRAFQDALHRFETRGKFLSFQIVLILSILLDLIINILVANNVIPCNDVLSSAARGDRVFHICLVICMMPLCLMGRAFYRRANEATLLGDGIRRASQAHIQHKHDKEMAEVDIEAEVDLDNNIDGGEVKDSLVSAPESDV